jgi:hypothetical protein
MIIGCRDMSWAACRSIGFHAVPLVGGGDGIGNGIAALLEIDSIGKAYAAAGAVADACCAVGTSKLDSLPDRRGERMDRRHADVSLCEKYRRRFKPIRAAPFVGIFILNH